MKRFNTFTLVAITSLFFAITVMGGGVASAATLNVVGGQLMGASNVLVDGNLYDVQFLDGTCIDLYNGCDEVSDFTFQTEASATLASQALLDQVFLDVGAGLFDTDPSLTNGCSHVDFCHARTPYGVESLAFNYSSAVNEVDLDGGRDGMGNQISVGGSQSYLHDSPQIISAYVLWAPVPEPSTALLMGLGLTGLAGKGRRRNRS